MKNNISFFQQPKLWFAIIALFPALFALINILNSYNLLSSNKIVQVKDNINLKSKISTKQRLEELEASIINSWEQSAQAKGLLYSIPKQFQGAIIQEGKVNTAKKVVALTFDDGPWNKNTDKILDILKQNNVKATFFMLGDSLINFPQPAKRITEEGHALGNHTWHHFYRGMSEEVAGREIESTSDLIYKTTGVKTTLFRPPGGIMTNGVVDYAKKHNYTIVMWSADSIDYSHPPVEVLVNRVIKQAKPGGIVLMHDGGGNNRAQTIAALPQIVSKLKAQGYTFVTIPELLRLSDVAKNGSIVHSVLNFN